MVYCGETFFCAPVYPPKNFFSLHDRQVRFNSQPIITIYYPHNMPFFKNPGTIYYEVWEELLFLFHRPD